MTHQTRLAILVAGGPAPGINSVISAATIRSQLEGVEVVGIRDGFEWIMRGDIEHTTALTIESVSRIHFRGGSHIGISRANPTVSPEHLEQSIVLGTWTTRMRPRPCSSSFIAENAVSSPPMVISMSTFSRSSETMDCSRCSGLTVGFAREMPMCDPPRK